MKKRSLVIAATGLLGVMCAAGPSALAKDSATPTSTTSPSSGSSVVITSGSGFGGPLQRLGIRTAQGGIRIRVYKGAMPVPTNLPPGCFPDERLLVEISTPKVAAQVEFDGFSSKPFGTNAQVVGIGEGTPIGVVVGQLPKGTRNAAMHFAKGPVDAMAPLRDGWVALAAPVKNASGSTHPVPLLTDLNPSLGLLRVTDAKGHTTTQLASQGGGGFAPRPECFTQPGPGPVPLVTTPSTLPPAGAPPADPTGAQREIEAAYTKVFTNKAQKPQDPNVLEGYPLLTEAQQAELRKGYGDILGKIKVRFNDFRFVSPTEAALSFDLLLDGSPITATTIGRAVLQDGHWKVAKATFCQILGRGNIKCVK
jgi:hypothetical protein